ncbi:peptide deformylase [Clostridium massiliamazoniense]|uniref:peptide deformylase n=1 Tax=Clostridium massiliamazoniense TaxID=1347366 RepID=UPI0006D78390|nr:peptide deformylase [Clostridium massiliamazoniense]
MAIRNIRIEDDEILRKKSKEVKEITPRIEILVKDMIETMYHNDGVGLAAVQVGILKRIFVVDIQDDTGVKVFINPEILEKSGEELGPEGCLSLPGERDEVKRATYVKIKAQDIEGKEFILEATELLARAIQHEYDHLDGILFVDYNR